MKKRILIVEDHADIRKLIRLTLEFEDYEIHEVARGDDGVEAAQRLKPRLLLMDVAVLFTEHSMDVVFAHADRIIVLARGRLIAQGSPEFVREHPLVKEVYFGTGVASNGLATNLAHELNKRGGQHAQNL